MARLLILFLLFNISSAPADNCQYQPSPPDSGHATGAANIAKAWFAGPTTRYAHGVLGDTIEAETLYVLLRDSNRCALSVTLENHSVFEDLTPRIADVTGDGQEDIITIESHKDYGAALAIYGVKKNVLVKLTSTPYIGTRYRWLAPVGSEDFNSDSISDVALVETPHLSGVLKIWSFKNARPKLLASQPGFSNHRIGENFVSGGITVCDNRPQIVVPDRHWSHTHRVQLIDGELRSERVADNTNGSTIEKLLNCQY